MSIKPSVMLANISGDAKRIAARNGHRMARWLTGSKMASCYCHHCGAELSVHADGRFEEIQGEAMERRCTGPKKFKIKAKVLAFTKS